VTSENLEYVLNRCDYFGVDHDQIPFQAIRRYGQVDIPKGLAMTKFFSDCRTAAYTIKDAIRSDSVFCSMVLAGIFAPFPSIDNA
jgi:hypothetical protein